MNKMKHTVIMNLLLFIGLDPQNSVWATLVNNGDMESLHVMVVVPTPNGDSCLQPKWERVEEILPGAHIAVNEINDSPNLLSTYLVRLSLLLGISHHRRTNLLVLLDTFVTT